MELTTYFDEFLSKIGPTKTQKEIMAREHKKLRELLMADPALKPVLLSTFIQGSQRRSTSLLGTEEHHCDVDLVAVTNFPRGKQTAAATHAIFQPFLEKHYRGRYKPQDRSWCIFVDPQVTMDLVPTSEPDSKELREAVKMRDLLDWDPEAFLGTSTGAGLSKTLLEAELEEARRDQQWEKSEPLWIPDRKLHAWEKTHPLYLISWTAKKNQDCRGHFARVVKAVKWWRRNKSPLPKYPKGYPLEHVIGECCPNGITSVAQGVTRALSEIGVRYQPDVQAAKTPCLPAKGVKEPEVDVMRRVTPTDFAGFHAAIVSASSLAQRAYDSKDDRESAGLWYALFGDPFPKPPEDPVRRTGGFTPPVSPARPQEGRFA